MRPIFRSIAAVAALALGVAPAAAQPPGTEGSLRFRIGAFYPSGDSSFWDVNESTFTLDRSDFNDTIVGASYVASIGNRLEIGFNVDVYDDIERSAYRDFVDEDGFPILHDTRLRIVPVSADVRFLPAGRYAARGKAGRHLVRRPAFFLGAGIGVSYWEYEEVGDFVASDLSIFFDRLKDSGTAFTTHVTAGVDFPVGPYWNVTGEGRYSWSEATPGGDFRSLGLGDLDLGGFAAFVGLSRQF